MKRRSFLKSTAVLSAPLFLKGIPVLASSDIQNKSLETLATASSNCGKIMVIIQMNGGNDGLNTVFPLDEWSNLVNARSNILMNETDVLPLNDNKTTGLHPAMKELQELHNLGKLMIVQGVSYPNPSYSHFRATDIWFTGSGSETTLETGWIGRTLNEVYPGFPLAYPTTDMPDPLAIQIGSTLPFSLQGPKITMGYSVPDPNDLLNVINATTDPAPNSDYGNELTFLRLMKDQSNVYREAIQKAFSMPQAQTAVYPSKNELADQLKIVAKLINGGLQTPIYIVNHPDSFDSHEGQIETADKTLGKQANNLRILSQAIGAFQEDLKLMSKDEKVTGMTYSEFGRRIKSNDSLGTDHGAGAPVIFFGAALNTSPRQVKYTDYPTYGMIGKSPALPQNADVNNQVPMQFDFRQIYTSIMQDWLCMTAEQAKTVLGGDFKTLPIFKTNSIDYGYGENFITIYPNPVTENQINIRFEDFMNTTVNIGIFNLLGSKVFSNSFFVGGNILNFSYNTTLAPAAYILEVEFSNHKFYKEIIIG